MQIGAVIPCHPPTSTYVSGNAILTHVSQIP
jgi:hypothetical protein